MFYKTPPTTLHIELSSKCNASCPMCSRNNQGFGINSKLDSKLDSAIAGKNLSFVDIKNHLTVDFIKNLKRLIVCGNFGDPLMNPEIILIFEYFKEVNPSLKIELHTNGGLGSSEIWAKLAKLVFFCRFGIDGLSDTNSIYRRGVNWNVLMKNVTTFIQAGGRAEWAFLVFKHNQDQLKEAEEMSVKMGFKKFIPKWSTRAIQTDGSFIDRWPVYSSEDHLEYYIEASEGEKNQNHINSLLKIKNEYQSYQNYLEMTTIDCKVYHEDSIYIAVNGFVFPCCWTAIDYSLSGENKKGSVKNLLKNNDLDTKLIQFKELPIELIYTGRLFQLIKEAWSNQYKLFKCSKVCGKSFDPFKAQFGD